MQLTSNTAAFIEAEQYSKFILTNLHDGLLPTQFYRDVSDFASGTTLNIKTIGTATLQDVSENQPLVYAPIDTSTVTMAITEYRGDAWYVTDVLRQDGAQVEQLMAARAMETTRAIQENFETVYLAAANDAQTPADANLVNGFAHRAEATGGTNPDQVMALADIAALALSFDKANVPMGGRVALVDPVVATTMALGFTGTFATDHTPIFENVLKEGFTREHRFVMHIYGFDFFTSNRLPRIATETIGVQIDNAVANIFMCVLDDNTKPMMIAWRQQPRAEAERNIPLQRDQFLTTARWGVGNQRVDTLGVILTSDSATS